ncbi:MAG: hypothetical protein WC595_06500 [Candidatus Nanoarchaeia archaeon]
MNSKEKNILLIIYKDCLELKRKGVLTEFGEGQLEVCRILLEK